VEAIRLVNGGKRVGDAVYMHQALLAQQPGAVQDLVAAASRLADLDDGAFNVVRISTRRLEVAFLCYPDFFTDPFPVLRSSEPGGRSGVEVLAVAARLVRGQCIHGPSPRVCSHHIGSGYCFDPSSSSNTCPATFLPSARPAA
jgi:hypothetical protein